eukprot:2491515-Rhodomonas_salina.1
MHSAKTVRVPAAAELLELLQREGCPVPTRRDADAADPLDSVSDVSGEKERVTAKKARASCFEREEAIHLVHIFKSRTLKEAIRLAAAEQIAQLAEEEHFLSCLLLAGLLDAVLAECELASSPLVRLPRPGRQPGRLWRPR